MLESKKLPEPLVTPSTKAKAGAHDENISPETAEGHIGKELYLRIADIALRLYTTAAEYALSRGLIADTKFEFGICVAFKEYLRF